MGRGTSKAGGGSAAQTVTQTAAPAPVANSAPLSNAPTNAQALTDAEAAQLRQDQNDMYDANTIAAIKMYISDTDFDNQGHSLSQTMNYLADQGIDINNTTPQEIYKKTGVRVDVDDIASMQYTDSRMQAAMHTIGKDVTLTRGAHDAVLRNHFKIANYENYSEQQLKSKLVGQSFTTTSYMSTAYDNSKNPFFGNGKAAGGREVVYNIKAGSNTKMVFGAKSQAEIVLDKGTNFRITDVRYTGKTVTPRSGRSRKQIIIDIETY